MALKKDISVSTQFKNIPFLPA